ncbi:proton-conducting transporter membrane subunit [Fundidesulfovibrio butyratiphilus]
MSLYFAALGVILASGLLALLAGRSPTANIVGPLGVAAGCAMGLIFACEQLIGGGVWSLTMAWHLPLGRFGLCFDGLTNFFLVPTFLLGGLCAVYGRSSLSFFEGKKNLGAHWFFYSLMVAGQALVYAASDGVLFLAAWEIMSVAPFFLISFNDIDSEVRSAAWTYLVAAHAGLAFLLGFMLLTSAQVGGSFAFTSMVGSLKGTTAVAAFLLALAGFGVKAGIAPLHVWLPEAHPAAPSHVSAYLSGSIIKAGIYGLMRSMTFLAQPEPWQAYLLVTLGLLTALLGIVQAMGKHHLKRLLAYSSVENVGLITMGLGLYLLGRSTGHLDLAALALGGALLHVLAHALMKGSLFLSAGAVLHGAGTVMMNRLGGLMKVMPVTGRIFALGAAAICGLPPLAGFVGELLLYLAAGRLGLALSGPGALTAWTALAGLALVGGIAAIVFVKALGATFLGEPRSEATSHAHDPHRGETIPMVLLGLGVAAFGLSGPWMLSLAAPAMAAAASGSAAAQVLAALGSAMSALWALSMANVALLVLAGLLVVFRFGLLRARPVGSTGTWDCGYSAPTARMQYTASSFSDPMTHLLGGFSGSSSRLDPPVGYFPAKASYAELAPDLVKERGFGPFFSMVDWVAGHLKWLQHGNLNLYILSIMVTLMALLAYNFLAQ